MYFNKVFLLSFISSLIILIPSSLNLSLKAETSCENESDCSYLLSKQEANHSEKLEDLQTKLVDCLIRENKLCIQATLFDIGKIYHQISDYPWSIRYYKESIRFTQPGIPESQKMAGRVWTNLSDVYLQIGEYQQSIKDSKKALKYAQDSNDDSNESVALMNLGSAYNRICQYKDSRDNHEHSKEIAETYNYRKQMADVYGNLGNLEQTLGNPISALDYHQKNLKIAQEIAIKDSNNIDAKKSVANALGNIGSAYHSLANYQEAKNYHQKRKNLAEKINDAQGIAKAKSDLGSVYYRYGEFKKAINYHTEYLNWAKANNDLRGAVNSLLNLASDYNALGQPEKSFELIEEALPIAEEIGDCQAEANALNVKGLALKDMGSYKKAETYFKKSINISQKYNNEWSISHATGNLGSTYLIWGIQDNKPELYQKAIKNYQIKLSIIEKFNNKDFRSRGAVLANIGVAHTKLGNYQKASDSFQEALNIFRNIGDRDSEGKALAGKAFLQQEQGNTNEAIELYKQAIEIKENIRSQLMVGAFKSSFEARQIDTYKKIIKLLWDRGDKQEAFNYVERARAKTFLDQLANGQINFRTKAKPELLQQEQELQEQKIAKRNQLMGLKNSNQRDEIAIAKVEAELTKIETEYTNLLTKIELEHPEVVSLISLQPRQLLPLAQIQEKLAKDTTLIEYFVTQDRIFAFVITANDFDSIEIKKLTENQVKEALKKFEQSDPKKNPHRQNSHPEALLKLHEWLIEPLQAHLSASTSNLIIAPHGILHYVPFAGLTDGNKYLIDRYNLSTIPSANVLNFIDKKNSVKDESLTPGNSIIKFLLSKLNDARNFLWRDRNFSKKILILGNPDIDVSLPKLLHAQDEAETIAKLYRSTALVDQEATEIVVHSKANEAEILHLAAHGKYNNRNPLFSNIYLAKDESDQNKDKLGKNNGLLEVHEVYGLNLEKASLVVLSACETKIGDLSRGDEIVGLNRAFIYAGTPTVIASLWSVEDQSTRLIMEQFHNYLGKGMEKAKALGMAQKALRENHPHYSHPYYWAAFSLTGDGGKL